MKAVRNRRRGALRDARGFAIMSAIFLLIVLALLGAMIVALSSLQQVSSVRDLDSSRANFAARAGLQWGVYRALHDSSCAASTTLPALAGSSSGFTVTVTCVAYGPYDEGGNNVIVYTLNSVASKGTLGAIDFVERQMTGAVSVP